MTRQIIVIAYKGRDLVFFQVFPVSEEETALAVFKGLRSLPETEVTRSHMMTMELFGECLLHGIESLENDEP